MKIKVPCAVCAKIIERVPSHIKRNKEQFCSFACRDIRNGERHKGEKSSFWRGGKMPANCDTCKAPVMIYAHQLKEGIFCSRACFHAWQRVHFAGENNPRWRGGPKKNYYGPNWRAQSHAARVRDNYQCRRCGISQRALKRTLHVHHVTSFQSFGYRLGENNNYISANQIDNLVTLCPRCHNSVDIRRTSGHPVVVSCSHPMQERLQFGDDIDNALQ